MRSHDKTRNDRPCSLIGELVVPTKLGIHLCRVRLRVICLEMKNANVLMRGAACSQLNQLVPHSPQPVLTLMDRQPMAQVAQRMRQTKAVHTHQNWPYAPVRHSVLRLLRSIHNLPQCKCILGFRGILHQCNMQYAILQKNIALKYVT